MPVRLPWWQDRAGELVTKDMEKAEEFNAFFPHSLLVRLAFRNPGALRARGRYGAGNTHPQWRRCRLGNI